MAYNFELSDFSPIISFSSEMKWCYFGFSVFTQVSDDVENRVLLPYEALESSDIDKKALQRFTGVKEKIIKYKIGQNGIVCGINSIPFAPQLMIEEKTCFLQAELHNGAVPTEALVLYAHGLEMLTKIYATYGAPTDIIPRLDFSDKGLAFQFSRIDRNIDINQQFLDTMKQDIPYPSTIKASPLELTIGKISTSFEEGNAKTFIPMKMGNAKDRTSIACYTLSVLSRMQQASLLAVEK